MNGAATGPFCAQKSRRSFAQSMPWASAAGDRRHAAHRLREFETSYHDSPPWMGSFARLLDFTF